MKANQPNSGRAYWRSLDELAQTPEFRQWVEREFPEGASEWSDPVSRRHFVKIMSASFLLAGMGFAGSGCRRPVENLEPFGKMPENYVHGLPQYFATAIDVQGTTIPLVVKSNDGRPTKIEGNALFPGGNGGTDRWAQASILNLYDPDRAARFAFNGRNDSPEGAADFLANLSRTAKANGGEGLSFLIERSSSPSRRRLQQMISQKLPKARWYLNEPVDLGIHRRAASQAFGRSVRPTWVFDKADVIVSLDCDFIGSEPDAQNNIRRFAKRRHLAKTEDSILRLYAVESLYTLTGFNADHRLRLPSTAVVQVAAALAKAVQAGAVANLADLGFPEGVDTKWITECAKDLAANRGKSLVVAGHRQPLAVHLLALAMNAALGNLGQTLLLLEEPQSNEGSLAELAKAIGAGQVRTLIMLGGNPAYTAPVDVDWTGTLSKAKDLTIARLGYYEDESFPERGWHFPAAHFLELWGDAVTSDGTLVPVQPLIAPLMGGWTELEVLARIAGAEVTNPYAIVRETFAGYVHGGDVEAAWRKFLHDGFLANSAPKPVEARLNDGAVTQGLSEAKRPAPVSKTSLEVVFFRDYKVDDGRYSNNGWLQELPDPITKVVWDNVVLISRKTAKELDLKNHDVVEVRLGGRSVQGAIWVQPGFADYSLGVALGYGRKRAGRVGTGAGFNAYLIRSTGAENLASGATLEKTKETYPISTTQAHWSMEGRPIIKEANLEQFRQSPEFAKVMGVEEYPPEKPMYPNPFDELRKKGLHQWGMSIDLNMCVGCSACMVACQSENNVPIVGKDQVRRGREMHWLRIDRYYTGQPAKEQEYETYRKDEEQQFEEWIDNPQVVTQPMLCQHCEAAPCENVCPVNATSHDQEGLNVMTYNRCVGTRYCSNNCPYKVRRFNFFDYNKRPISGHKLYLGPLAHRPDDEWDLMKMSKNPDVTVRMRGVMEKCTFCLQRIEQAKIAQKTKAGATDDVVVPSGTFTTACAQACPAGAIVFGNLNDEKSEVSQRKALERNYPVLQGLLTKPRTTYLARIRNPNVNMPDYMPEGPLSLQEFEKKRGENPFEGKEKKSKAEAGGKSA